MNKARLRPLSDSEKHNYLLSVRQKKPQCPYCGSYQVVRYNSDTVNDIAYKKVYCDGCYADWREIYKLDDIESF